jgi:uncharacterized protein (DUF4415 family)
MPQTIKTRSGRTIIMPTPEEDSAITAAALSDINALPLTDTQLQAMRKIGRPRVASPKAPFTMRIDTDILQALRTSGQGWQTRVNAILREAVATGKV